MAMEMMTITTLMTTTTTFLKLPTSALSIPRP